MADTGGSNDIDRYMKDPFSMEGTLGEVESVRDIRKEALDRDNPRQIASAPVLPRLMYPEHSVSALAQPGGFRRHAVGNETHSSSFSSKYDAFLDLLPSYPDLQELRNNYETAEANESGTHKTGPVKAWFTLFKAFCGGGLLYFPRGFSLAGMLPACIIMTASALLSTISSLILINTMTKMEAKGHRIWSLQDLVRVTMGKRGLIFCNTALIGAQLGFACTYLLYAANYGLMLARQFTDCHTNLKIWELCTFLQPILYGMILVRHIKHYALTSALADVLMLTVVFYLIAYDGLKLNQHGGGDWEMFHSLPGSLMLLGTSCYAFEGTVMVIPIQKSMKKPSQFPMVLVSMICVYLVILIGFAATHYAWYGSGTGKLALENLPITSAASKVLTAFYMFVVANTYPLFLYPVSNTLEGWLGFAPFHSGKKWQKNGVRLALVLFVYGVAIGASSVLDYVISVMGAAFCIPLAILIPPLMELYVKKGWTPEDLRAKLQVQSEAEGGSGGGGWGLEQGTTEVGGGVEEPLLGSSDSEEEGEVEEKEKTLQEQGGGRGCWQAFMEPDYSVGTLWFLTIVAVVASVVGTAMAVYGFFHPDPDPISEAEYCAS